MDNRRLLWREVGVALAFFGLAALAILTTRADGGLAFVWIANAFLIAVLVQAPRRQWLRLSAGCFVASMAATAVVGIGWTAAPFLALANITESLVAAWLLRRARSSLMQLGSARWTLALLWSAGLAGPLAMAAVSMIPMWYITGEQPAVTVMRVVIGHGVSNMTFVPIFKLFLTGGSRLWRNRGWRRPTSADVPYFALFIAVTLFVFLQRGMALLFLPILPLTAIVFGGGSRRSAAALMLLGVIGGACTLAGRGPIPFAIGSRGYDMQFLQFYLLATVLTVVPIAAQLRSRRLLAAQVRSSEARYRLLADHSSDIITHTDLYGRALFVSPSMARIAGYAPHEVEGRNIMEFIDPAFHGRVADAYGRAIASCGDVQRFEYRAKLKSGELRWFESQCRGVAGPDGKTEGLVSIVRDISIRKQREDELAVAAQTDPLTGLANRRAFRESASRIAIDQRAGQTTIAVIDIDHFKLVNDRLGHDAGDEVLRGFSLVAQRLLRRHDVLARVGGEEFAIIFPGLDAAGAVRVCERIRAAVGNTPFVTAAGRVTITISGGVATLDDGGLDDALRRADQALYEAKAKGRDRLLLAA